jgi:ribose transport system ATP-binding protein
VRLRGAGSLKLRDIDLDLRAGEIVGLAGLQGSGRTRWRARSSASTRSTRGDDRARRVARSRSRPAAAIRAGMGFITEDRKIEGLALAQSVRDNALLAVRSIRPGRRAGGAKAKVDVERLAASTDVRARSLEQEVRFLSGGNQQKVVLAKWLATKPRLVIFDEPTRGIDVGAKAGIYDLMRGLAADGVAILMISSELPELIGMSDRILVMRHGAIAGELPAGAGEEPIMHLATGEDGAEVAA